MVLGRPGVVLTSGMREVYRQVHFLQREYGLTHDAALDTGLLETMMMLEDAGYQSARQGAGGLEEEILASWQEARP